MPELNSVYSELFSNKGSTFYLTRFSEDVDEISYFSEYLQNHEKALPIITMETSMEENYSMLQINVNILI